MKVSLLSNETNSQDPLAVHSRIFVGNLNTFQCSKSDVEQIFQRYGHLTGNSYSDQSRLHAHLTVCLFSADSGGQPIHHPQDPHSNGTTGESADDDVKWMLFELCIFMSVNFTII